MLLIFYYLITLERLLTIGDVPLVSQFILVDLVPCNTESCSKKYPKRKRLICYWDLSNGKRPGRIAIDTR
jgi:hypothetical protein